MNTKGNLTIRYAINQAIFFAAYCGAMAFASTYLLNEGITADKVGLILFGATFFSFLLQPIVADSADHADKNILPYLIAALTVLSLCCFASVRFLTLPRLAFAILYALGMLFFDIQTSLLNAVSVYYETRSWRLDYGIGRGAGSIGFAVMSLVLGRIMEDSSGLLLPITMVFILAGGVIAFTYPKDESLPEKAKETADASVSLLRFFAKYKWFSVSLLGVMLLGIIHIMTENYMIEILGRLGGGSSDLGIILFLSTAAEAPGIMLSSKIHKKTGSYGMFVICGIVFTAKMVLYLVAGSVPFMFAVSLLQFGSYAIFCPAQVFYAEECIPEMDMVKGQSTIYAAYSLGGALGNLIGGQVVANRGVPTMLVLSIVLSAVGFAVLVFTVPKAMKRKS